MGGGLLQLVAYGAQDVYLTGNPQITFFKVVYRRHTNFSIESIKQTFSGTADFGQEVSSTIQRSGDLISRMYLETTLPTVDISNGVTTGTSYKAFRWLNWIGHVLIKNTEIRIGGSKIDKHYGEWLHIWNELTQEPGKVSGYAEMVGNVPQLTQIYSSNTSATTCETGSYKLFIPLQFWFCRNPGLAIPLIALQYHDVVLNIEFRTLDECIWATSQTTSSSYADSTGTNVINSSTALSSSYLYVDYIYLDTDERRRFAQVAHEYLIEQLQYTGEENLSSTVGTSSQQIKLNFTHPVKEIIWVTQPTNFVSKDWSQSRAGRQYYNFTDAWDYTNFTGTPTPSSGPGMVGGRNTSLWYGLPTVKVAGTLNTSSTAWATTIATATSSTNSGYNDVSNYTYDSTTNNYSSRYMEQLIGPGIIQASNENKTALWAQNSNNTKIMDGGENPTSTGKIVLNGNDRFSERSGKYFNLVQPYQHHTNCPAPGINVYSFSITPEDHQPSGTCNFSRIDNAFLTITSTDNTTSSSANSGNAKVRVYATNYNILRIMSGMAGLAYSN